MGGQACQSLRKKCEGVTLLVLMMEEGVMSQGIQVADL